MGIRDDGAPSGLHHRGGQPAGRFQQAGTDMDVIRGALKRNRNFHPIKRR
jgi:hypothetical protein